MMVQAVGSLRDLQMTVQYISTTTGYRFIGRASSWVVREGIVNKIVSTKRPKPTYTEPKRGKPGGWAVVPPERKRNIPRAAWVLCACLLVVAGFAAVWRG